MSEGGPKTVDGVPWHVNLVPLQFQKQLRLQDARSLMLVDDIDVTTAAFSVGYEARRNSVANIAATLENRRCAI